MRLKPVKFLFTLLIISTIVIFWYILGRDIKSKDKQCRQPDIVIKQIHDLTNSVHHVLSTLGVTHWLCYGSLWGQIRIGRSLPWEFSAQICALNEEIAPVDELFLQRSLTKHGLTSSYSSSEGSYTIKASASLYENAPYVELILFELDRRSEMMRRIGWQRRLLPPSCAMVESLQCFPPRLIKTPLPLREFGGYVVPVPREGIEMQKYHYQFNWWKEIKPDGC